MSTGIPLEPDPHFIDELERSVENPADPLADGFMDPVGRNLDMFEQEMMTPPPAPDVLPPSNPELSPHDSGPLEMEVPATEPVEHASPTHAYHPENLEDSAPGLAKEPPPKAGVDWSRPRWEKAPKSLPHGRGIRTRRFSGFRRDLKIRPGAMEETQRPCQLRGGELVPESECEQCEYFTEQSQGRKECIFLSDSSQDDSQ